MNLQNSLSNLNDKSLKAFSQSKYSEEDVVFKARLQIHSINNDLSKETFIMKNNEASRNRTAGDSKTAALINFDGSCLKFDYIQ